MISFSYDTPEFMQVLSRYSSVIDINSREGILSYLLFILSPESLRLIGTNYTVTVVSTLYPLSSVDEEVRFCVDYYGLKQWLGYISRADDVASFTLNDAELVIRVRDNEATLRRNIVDPDRVKVFPLGKEEVASFPSNTFSSAVDNIVDLASAQEEHRVFQNTRLGITEDYFEFWATDGYIFGHQREAVSSSSGKHTFLVHAKALGPIRKALGSFESVSALEDERHIYFASRDCYVYSPKSSGKYPDMRPMMSEDHAHKALVSVDTLMRTLNASKGFSKKEMGKAVRIAFEDEGNHIVLGSLETVVGSNTDVLRAKSIIGGGISFIVNIDYMLTALSRIESLEAWIHYDEYEDGSPKHIHVTDTQGKQKFLIAAQRR